MLLISVAVATALMYPIPFLYTTDFASGASGLPHHVWTNAQPIKGTVVATEPDVVMRSIWVHGSYMRALERDVLLGALELQDDILGPTKDFNPRSPLNKVALSDPVADLTESERNAFHVVNGLTNQSWFFHSPLLYWSGDREMIENDPDIITTVNEHKNQHTSVNVTLRHSVVFSGKRFEDRALVAADALVITLIHLRDSPIGQQWERKEAELRSHTNAKWDKWDVYPKDGHSLSSQLYEFQFLPISIQDSIMLALAYSVTFVYLLQNLSKLPAIKSRPGLILTVIAQIFVSIMSSFTVCAILKIDLSRIPRAAYPIVVVSMSLENMLRLIKGVIATNSEESTSSRIGTAFGKTTHIAFVSVSSNQPSFFLPPISSALEMPRQSWIAAVLRGRIDVSTRIAGTIIMLCFVIIAQWHFFENESITRTFSRLFTLGTGSTNNLTSWSGASAQLRELHQARSPTSWLRLQDHETAQEVINVIKPLAHSYIARVYEPLVLVLKGSDRMPSVTERPFLPAVYDFIRHQFKPFLVTIFVITAAMRIFVNYLLWDELGEEDADFDVPEEPQLSVMTMNERHGLDIVLLTASSDGLVVSFGLDRSIRVWDVPSGINFPFGETSYPLPNHDSFPNDRVAVSAIAIDSDSKWLAILSNSKVLLWDLERRDWVWSNGTLVELWPDTGESLESRIGIGPLVCAVPLDQLHSSTTKSSTGGLVIIAASQDGSIHRVMQNGVGWESEKVRELARSEGKANSIVALPLLSAYLVARPRSVELVDLVTSETLHAFEAYTPIKANSLRHLSATRRQTQQGSHELSYFSLIYTSAETGNCVIQTYLPKDDDGSILLSPDDRPAVPPAGSGSSCMWHEVRQVVREVPNPGLWEALPNGSIIGVRETVDVSLNNNNNNKSKASGIEAAPGNVTSSVRRRGPNYNVPASKAQSAATGAATGTRPIKPPAKPRKPVDSNGGIIKREAWFVCSVVDSASGDAEKRTSSKNDTASSSATSTTSITSITSITSNNKDKNYVTTPLVVDGDEYKIADLGPIVCVGAGTIALGIGAALKIITMGHERFGSPADMLEVAAGQMLGTNSIANRRRKNRSHPKGAAA
ncbi:MAG: hypothetical protein STHCBS139747_004523 [Sporothrix thermara]